MATEGIWAGGPGGLYRYDGRIFPSIDGIREVAVSSIVLDDDGKGAWVGTFKNGLYHAEGDHAAPVPGGEAIFLDAVLGIAKTAAGTRLVAGNAGERTAALRADDGRRRRVSRPARAGRRRAGRSRRRRGADRRPARASHRRTRCAPLAPGRGVPGGQPQVRVAGARAHRPLGGGPHAGQAASRRDDGGVGAATIYMSACKRMGVARATPEGPRYLPGSQLVGDARRLYVACASRVHCFVVTDGPRAWLTDGDRYQPTRLGEPESATPLALATDAQGTTYAIARDAESSALVITRLASGLRAPVETDWQPLPKIALEVPPKTTPTVSFAAVSAANTLWLGLRVTDADGVDSGYGAAEIELGNGHAVQHRPPAPGEKVAAGGAAASVQPDGHPVRQRRDLLRVAVRRQPLAGRAAADLERERRAGQRVWCTRSRAAATARSGPRRPRGLARFDGQNWLPLGNDRAGRRAGLARDGKGRVWVATSKGLRALPPDAAGPAAPIRRAAPIVLAGDMRDVAADRFGRIWAMSTTSIALVEPK